MEITNSQDIEFDNAAKVLTAEIEHLIRLEGLALNYSINTPTPEKPFRMERIAVTDTWLSKVLMPNDLQRLQALIKVNDYGNGFFVFDPLRNSKGIRYDFRFTHVEYYSPKEIAFLMNYGTEEIKQRYRLVSLFSENETIPTSHMDADEFEKDMRTVGHGIAEELSELLTTSITPVYHHIQLKIQKVQKQFLKIPANTLSNSSSKTNK